LSRFKKQTDALKFLCFVADECRTSKGMKNPEVNALIIGKMMCLTATVESQLYQTSASQLNHDALNMVTNDLLQMYKDHDYVRESIQAILVKVLSQITPLTQGGKILDRVLVEVLGNGAEWKSAIFKHSDNLSLFLAMRSVYLSHEYEGHVRENEHMLKTEVFSASADNT
jgi:hypothetical protein